MKAQADIDFANLYLGWLKENIEQFQVNQNTFRLTLPFLDRNNDYVELYIIHKEDNTFYITDDGAVLNDLDFNGFDFKSSEKRKFILSSIISAHGVTLSEDNELTVSCTLDDLPQKKHLLAQCMIKVSDMFYLSKPNVQSLFLEDVQNFLDKYDVRYFENFSLVGKSKLSTHYDFAIAKSKQAPERLIKVVNKLDLNAARNIIFAWNDTKDMRVSNSELYTFIKDTDRKLSSDAIGALEEYGIKPALWSNREEYVRMLTA